MPDYTPEGDEIKTFTIWLPFAEGDVAISADATGFYARLKQASAAVERAEERSRFREGCRAALDFDATLQRIQELVNQSPAELEALGKRIRDLGTGEGE